VKKEERVSKDTSMLEETISDIIKGPDSKADAFKILMQVCSHTELMRFRVTYRHKVFLLFNSTINPNNVPCTVTETRRLCKPGVLLGVNTSWRLEVSLVAKRYSGASEK
jgi:hypothetical protein